MTTQEDRGPLSTEIPISETEVDPRASGRCDSRTHDPNRSEAEATTDERLSIGERLSGRYRIERELGEGGMGVVYLVSDEQVAGETFAVKILKEVLDPEALRLLREEVRKTRKLSHPNIVDVHSVNVDGSRVYVLMESLEGKSLNALLDEEFGRGMPFSHAWPIIEDVGAALGNAHDHNVIHSDLKPANVFVTNSGRTKLLDFGIARVSRGPLLHQRSGPLALTPAYASCEMLEGEEADTRDDIYSFACVIYEMLCGKRPFGELTALEARDAGAQVPPLGVLSREQNGALAQGLAFDRKGRTSSVEQLLEGLAERKSRTRPRRAVLAGAIIAAVVVLGLTFWGLEKLWISRHSNVVQSVPPEAQQAAARATATPNVAAAFNPPPHSIAVLPFVNISGDREQEYFSDGLSEELLNSLSRVNELQVAARTSSFYFKGEHADLTTIAHKLNVASVLEGSVRRSGRTIRVTAQLNNAVTGYHLWSETYDRDLKDVLKLQTEIANAVANALKVTLLGDVAGKIEVGGTRNPAAFDAYLRAFKTYWEPQSDEPQSAEKATQLAIDGYTDAIRLDPDYALAFAGRSLAVQNLARFWTATPSARRAFLDKAEADARKAMALVPDLSEGHLALAMAYWWELDFKSASGACERALALGPGNARVLRDCGALDVVTGHSDSGLRSLYRALALDPLNPDSHSSLGSALLDLRRYPEALAAYKDADTLASGLDDYAAGIGTVYYLLGDFESARSFCETKPERPLYSFCLTMTYDKLGRHADAETMLAKIRASAGDVPAFGYSVMYAQWGDTARALDWLEAAMRTHDAFYLDLKSPLLDPLRKEPRFQAVERELKFPQ